MKKTFLVASLFLLCTQILNAQQTKITWGELSKVELEFNSFVKGAGTDMIKLCLDVKKSFFGSAKYTPILVRYDEKLQEKNSQEFKADEEGVKMDKVFSIRGKLYMFSNKYDKETKTTTYMCVPIDIVSLKPSGKIITLATIDAKSKGHQSMVTYQLSADSTKVLMFGISPYSKKDNEKYYIGVYDDNMNKLWDKTVELPYQDKYVSVLSRLITNEGKVGVIIKHYDQEVNRESIRENGERVPSYKAKLLLYENEIAKPYEFVLNIGNKFVHSLGLTDDKASTMNLFGLYKERYNGHVNGFFTASINLNTHQIETNKLSAFPQELVELVKKDKQGSDKERDPGIDEYFNYVRTITRKDGSVDYLLEYQREIYHEETRDSKGYVISRAYWEYINGDVIDISVKTDGKFVLCRIPKMQDINNTKSCNSFRTLIYNDKLVLYYNDDEDNMDKDLSKRPDVMRRLNKCVFMSAVIDAKGNLTRNIVFNHKEVKLTVATLDCFPLDNSRLGIYSFKVGGLFSSSKDMLGILELK